jgi:hypothetical protein
MPGTGEKARILETSRKPSYCDWLIFQRGREAERGQINQCCEYRETRQFGNCAIFIFLCGLHRCVQCIWSHPPHSLPPTLLDPNISSSQPHALLLILAHQVHWSYLYVHRYGVICWSMDNHPGTKKMILLSLCSHQPPIAPQGWASRNRALLKRNWGREWLKLDPSGLGYMGI